MSLPLSPPFFSIVIASEAKQSPTKVMAEFGIAAVAEFALRVTEGLPRNDRMVFKANNNYEMIRKAFAAAPKYGNDDDEVDSIAARNCINSF